ncbi:hypothetical protein BC832DRAFT_594481 [Gaertneriomyces semiglobifer]|nr:hypothetical protein BC832DRAFT_594481 [Gaertneriomyces semiglobifer]
MEFLLHNDPTLGYTGASTPSFLGMMRDSLKSASGSGVQTPSRFLEEEGTGFKFTPSILTSYAIGDFNPFDDSFRAQIEEAVNNLNSSLSNGSTAVTTAATLVATNVASMVMNQHQQPQSSGVSPLPPAPEPTFALPAQIPAKHKSPQQHLQQPYMNPAPYGGNMSGMLHGDMPHNVPAGPMGNMMANSMMMLPPGAEPHAYPPNVPADGMRYQMPYPMHDPSQPATMNPATINPTSINPTSINPTSLNPTSLNPTSLNPSLKSGLNKRFSPYPFDERRDSMLSATSTEAGVASGALGGDKKKRGGAKKRSPRKRNDTATTTASEQSSPDIIKNEGSPTLSANDRTITPPDENDMAAESATGRNSRRRSSNAPLTPSRLRFLEKNRIAASKCRAKKKAWQQELEAKAANMESLNRELNGVVSSLKEEMLGLKSMLLLHQGCGCNVIQTYIQRSAQFTQQLTAPQAPPFVDPTHLASSDMSVSCPGMVGVPQPMAPGHAMMV